MYNGETFVDKCGCGKVEDDFDSGDLGLGSGLKPGSIGTPTKLPLYTLPLTPPSDTPKGNHCFNSPLHKEALSSTNPDSQRRNSAEKEKKSSKLSRLFSRSSSHSSRKSSDDHEQLDAEVFNREEAFPSYADIPYGTSIRQQKLLFEQDLGHILQRKTPLNDTADSDTSAGSNGKAVCYLRSDEIERKLLQANQEVEELKLELENCQRRLDAKYQAIEILKQQAETAEEATEEHDKEKREYSQQLEKDAEKEINHLQFVLDYHQSSTLNSQRTWAERFDRACQESSSLMVTLKTRSEELRKVTARNMALLQEREELLALLDVQERQQYEKSRTSGSEDNYNHFTSAELAVLGACMCRGRRPEPCGCALAAANMRKEIVKLREEMDMYQQRTDEAYTTVEAYRIAFEEQIVRNKELGVKMAEICAPSPTRSTGSKAKSVIKWIISNINEDDLSPPLRSQGEPANHVHVAQKIRRESGDLDLSHMTDRELLVMLLEMINEKNELRAHQKVAAKILAKKTQELESKLAANGELPDT